MIKQAQLTTLPWTWIRIFLLIVIFVALLGESNLAECPDQDSPISPKDDVINLLHGENFDGLYTFLEDTQYDDPRRVFTVNNAILTISGDGYGGISTKQSYCNYRLICEFKWGERVWGTRKLRARDSGILIHGHGKDGAYFGKWMTSIEAQIIEGGTGDIIVVNQKEAGHPCLTSVTAEITLDRDGEPIWHRGGKKSSFCEGRINWFGRDPDWRDVLGFHGKDDIKPLPDGWTQMEIICEADTICVIVNGVMVNKVFDVVPSDGKILLQSELAEIKIRRWELWPLTTKLVGVKQCDSSDRRTAKPVGCKNSSPQETTENLPSTNTKQP